MTCSKSIDNDVIFLKYVLNVYSLIRKTDVKPYRIILIIIPCNNPK